MPMLTCSAERPCNLWVTSHGRAQAARQHSDQAVTLNGRNPDVIFRRGVMFALIGDAASAVAALKDALNHGYTVEQIRTEDDLARLSNDPEFRKLIGSKR